MATLDNVEPDLRARCEGMLSDRPRLWVSSAHRSRVSQLALWLKFLAGLGAPANRPGSSKHERTPADAVDIGCLPRDIAERALLARKWGLHTPIRGEPWHMERAPNAAPLPKQKIEQPDQEEEEELPRYADKYTWPDGTSVQVYPDGAVKNYGSRHWGSIHSLKAEYKRSFTRADSIRPVNPDDSNAGYIVGNENGDEFTFDLSVARFRK